MLIKQGERLINARNWSELVKPDQIMREEETASVTHGKFICEPLERGYGTTVGNAMLSPETRISTIRLGLPLRRKKSPRKA